MYFLLKKGTYIARWNIDTQNSHILKDVHFPNHQIAKENLKTSGTSVCFVSSQGTRVSSGAEVVRTVDRNNTAQLGRDWDVCWCFFPQSFEKMLLVKLDHFCRGERIVETT